MTGALSDKNIEELLCESDYETILTPKTKTPRNLITLRGPHRQNRRRSLKMTYHKVRSEGRKSIIANQYPRILSLT